MARDEMQLSPSRRKLLKMIGLAGAATATGMFWPRLGAAQEEPAAAAVEDRASRIRISGLRTHIAAGRVFLRLDTNLGVSGWGEVRGLDPNVVQPLLKSLFELLNEQNPTRIEYLWQRMFRAHRNMRGGPFMVHTIAGIDLALWDIAGKLWQTPVYRLLGGPCRDKIRVYPTAKAYKVGPQGLREHSSSPLDVERIVSAIKRAREQVGPDGAVMYDAHSAVPPATLIQVANAIEPCDVLFIEEPWVPGNIEVCKRIRESVNVPLATGERERTIWDFIELLQAGVVDIVQPDVIHSGGITQLRKIAALAEAYYVPMAPHCTSSFLGMTSSLHVSAAVPLFLIHELYPEQGLPDIVKKNWTIDKDGYASLPDGVGLGVEIDEAALARAEADPLAAKFTWPDSKLKDGSVSDY